MEIRRSTPWCGSRTCSRARGGPIPDGATIGSAELSYVVDDNGNPGNVHEVLIDWDANVTHAGFGASAGAQAGVDYAATALPQQANGTLVGTQTTYTIDVTSSLNAWRANPASNKGWIIAPTGASGVGIRSSEHGTSDHRPKLAVRCLPEPSPTLSWAGGVLALAGLTRTRRRRVD
jgi:MYXO-CTERM domain-containing protein